MTVRTRDADTRWLMLTFTLPTKRASKRVEVWRTLQRYGAVPLGNSGYLLPNNSSNRERFEWLAQMIRKHAGEASVVSVQSIDNLSTPQLVARFAEARGREQAFMEHHGTKNGFPGNVYNSVNTSRTDPRGRAFAKEYRKKLKQLDGA